jgi:tetratricopeptide (TPR) repeat protein
MENYKTIILILFFFCTVVEASEIKISSNPIGGLIYVQDAKKGQRIKVGETPFKGSLDQLVSSLPDKAAFVVEVSKVGFEPYRILLTKTGSMDIDLDVNLEISKNLEMVQDLDLLTGDLFDVQRMIRVKDFLSSLKKLDLLERKFPHYSIIAEMKGSVFYLMKEYKRSLGFYRKAFALNPENREAYQMKLYLEKKFKINEKEKG